MTDELYLIAITALLPLTALMVVLQVNPYQALVLRGILGAIAALTYALFGAADVALTEALVGTMLSITLYAVAVRSSMEMRLGWVQPPAPVLPDLEASDSDLELSNPIPEAESVADPTDAACLETGILSGSVPTALDETLVATLRKILKSHHLRLEVLAYPSAEALQIALETKRIHTALLPSEQQGSYQLQTRVKRLHEILNNSLPASVTEVDYLDLAQAGVAAPSTAQPPLAHSAQESP